MAAMSIFSLCAVLLAGAAQVSAQTQSLWGQCMLEPSVLFAHLPDVRSYLTLSTTRWREWLYRANRLRLRILLQHAERVVRAMHAWSGYVAPSQVCRSYAGRYLC
jgi:hypothetical protein